MSPPNTRFSPQPIIVSALVAVVEMAAMLGLEELCETGVGALFKVWGSVRKVSEVWGEGGLGGAVRDGGGRAVQGEVGEKEVQGGPGQGEDAAVTVWSPCCFVYKRMSDKLTPCDS